MTLAQGLGIGGGFLMHSGRSRFLPSSEPPYGSSGGWGFGGGSSLGTSSPSHLRYPMNSYKTREELKQQLASEEDNDAAPPSASDDETTRWDW